MVSDGLRGISIAGRGDWPVGVDALEPYIADAYEPTALELGVPVSTD